MGSLWVILFFCAGMVHWRAGDLELMYLAFIAMSVNLTDVNLDLLREKIGF